MEAKKNQKLIGKIVAVVVILIAIVAFYIYTPLYSLTNLLKTSEAPLERIVIVEIASEKIEEPKVLIIDEEDALEAFVKEADTIGFRRAAPFTVKTFASPPGSQYYLHTLAEDGSETRYLSIEGSMLNLAGSFFDRFRKQGDKDAESFFAAIVAAE